jgi:ABC-type antimicrobial peptide transport system permease subunit
MEKVPDVYYALESVPFVPNSLFIDAGVEINNVVVVFNDFFILISAILILSILLILCFNANGNINQNKYEIGVFKALGMKNIDVTLIFILQILISTVLTILLFTVGICIFTNITNNILFESFMLYLKNPALKMINILSFNPLMFVLDILLIMGINAFTTVIPFIKMRRLKPINILRK